jgi:hypothetical protein
MRHLTWLRDHILQQQLGAAMAIRKEVILGSSKAYPLPRNTFATAYAADSSTRLVILNASKPTEVSVTSNLVGGRTILSIERSEKK